MSVPQLSLQTTLLGKDVFSDARTHGYIGPSRNVRFPRACASGGAAICGNEDTTRCAIAGKESLRIVRVLDPSEARNPDHKSVVGHGGFRAEASRNFWDGSGLKIDSASTDVAWGSGQFNNKILTSARNGELIMWDVNKSKHERRVKDHSRSIHKLSLSHIVQHYCITGSSDGDLRIWDIRDLSKSINRIRFPTTIRSLVFSPIVSQPLQIMVGLDNGNIYRWELKMAQRGQLDRVPVAHTAPVTALDWRPLESGSSLGGVEPNATGLGWIVSGGLDRTVKVWDLSWPSISSHIQHKPTYTIHSSFPVRHVHWRPGYDCELAVVSNAEFSSGSNPDMNASSSALHRSTSTLGLLSDPTVKDGQARKMAASASSSGDPIEIWDVRRGWIAKWSVAGSAIEGGVTGMMFRDSHAIWTQHSSGMFSQIDLRDCVKPLDSITRVSTTWEASGSMAFVSDRPQIWEAPYDDIPVEQRDKLPEHNRGALKALGDPSYIPESQTAGTYNTADNAEDTETFSRLAKAYVFRGQARKDLCAINAQLAFQAGKTHAGQVWLLVGASLSNITVEDKTPTESLSSSRPPLVHSLSTQTQVPTLATPSPTYAFPPPNTPAKSSPVKTSSHSAERDRRSTSGSRIMTPASSKHPSPGQGTVALPSTPVPPSVLSRRDSLDGSSPLLSSRRSSVYRRPSMSTHHSSSPVGNSSLRHIGEGTLDDSDSSGSGSGESKEHGSSDEEPLLRPLMSPTLSMARASSSHLSPLSRFVSQKDDDGDENENGDKDDDEYDEDDERSPSPRSTDSESEEDDARSYRSSSRARSNSKRPTKQRSYQKLKSRSRASTGGSMTLGVVRSVLRKASHSSVKTVTGGDPPPLHKGIKAEETIKDLGHSREKSVAVSEMAFDEDPPLQQLEHDTTDRRSDLVVEEEEKFRALAWGALRECLEEFADNGDVQMCAMLALVAGEELGLKKRRIMAFLDAYIDLLTRLRLHTPSGYIRKYCDAEQIREASLLETTIYTSCGRCRKALSIPLGVSQRNPNGGYWLCQTCKGHPISCSICRMPVRGLLFQCSVCSHGGHQYCYQRYYLNRPMTELPRKFLPSGHDDRGRSVTRGTMNTNTLSLNDDDAGSMISSSGFGDSQVDTAHPLPSENLMGHACAAGCGHYCWAATGSRDD